MGLSEHIRLGADLRRYTTVLQTSPSGSGSVELGSSYILLGVGTDIPCRLRIYDNISSLNNSVEKTRTFGNNNVPDDIALVTDISMSTADERFSIDPTPYGVVENPVSKLSYYKIDNVGVGVYPTVTFYTFLLEDADVLTSNRKNLPDISAILTTTAISSGSILSTDIPTTYLMVSASVQPAAARARLRLYTNSQSLYNSSEISRSFSTESSANTGLIVDAIITGSNVMYFVPKIIGANLQNVSTDLNDLRGSNSLLLGDNEIYYILQNVSVSGATFAITASTHIFSIED